MERQGAVSGPVRREYNDQHNILKDPVLEPARFFREMDLFQAMEAYVDQRAEEQTR
jgi:hypothetical protein